MRLAWLTDIHLNFLKGAALGEYVAHVMSQEPDAIIITGDIAEAHNLEDYLMVFEDSLKKFMPHCLLYFVLGNHDYYRSGVEPVRAGMEMLTLETDQLIWLQTSGVIALTPKVALIGHDGWCDARLGNYDRSNVRMGDFHGAPDQGFPLPLISDFIGLTHGELKRKLQDLGDEAGNHIREILPKALEKFEHCIVATHIPPFREAATYRGKVSNDNWLPFFTCKAVGDALVDVAQDYPDSHVTVLCGHTHSSSKIQIAHNLDVVTGHARYEKPTIQKIIEISDTDLIWHKPKRKPRKSKN
jgi:3',5'-cyclic AMP phosphodiesterase CpdA